MRRCTINTVIVNRSIIKIDDENIDVSSLSVPQIQYMAQLEKQIYAKLIFTRCGNGFIRDAVGYTSSPSGVYVPVKFRKSTMMVK